MHGFRANWSISSALLYDYTLKVKCVMTVDCVSRLPVTQNTAFRVSLRMTLAHSSPLQPDVSVLLPLDDPAMHQPLSANMGVSMRGLEMFY